MMGDWTGSDCNCGTSGQAAIDNWNNQSITTADGADFAFSQTAVASFLCKGGNQSPVAQGQYWADEMVQGQVLSYDMMLFDGCSYENTWDATYTKNMNTYNGLAAMGWWAENNCLAHHN